MRPVIRYGGREMTGPSEWTVSFDLVDDTPTTRRYWFRFSTDDPLEPIDVNVPNFWGYMAYLGGKWIENKVFINRATGELYAPTDEALERASSSLMGLVEPDIGQICWRIGSPPYEGDTSGDAFRVG